MPNLNESLLNTPDLNAERLNTLKTLFSDLFTVEGRLNPDELTKLVDPEHTGEPERYEFKWFGKANAKRNAFTPTNTTLVFDEQRSVNPDKSENIIIEGENLEVLKLLLCGYREKIKCIYIDPPYNTGKDFVYSDNYTEEKRPYWEKTGAIQDGVKTDTNPDTSGRYHSDWLDMMYSRLLVARALLKPDGVIFISIDDNEVHNLRKLCDEVLGAENFIDCIIWKKRYGGGTKEKYLVSVHEYAFVYCKNITEIKPMFIETSEESVARYYTLEDEHVNERGKYRTHPLEATKSMGDRPNLIFPIIAPDGKEVHPKRQWLWSEERVKSALESDELEFIEDRDGGWSVHTKQYLLDEDGNIRGTKAFSLIDDVFTQHGTNEIIDLFGNAQIFSFPKPTAFIKKLLLLGSKSDENDIVLDFFGGSGVTGQSVIELNVKDGGNRRFILAQLPELTDEKSEAFKAGYKKISDITIERNKRAIEKMEGDKENLGFKVFKLVESNFPRTEFKPDEGHTDEENLAALQEYIRGKEAQQAFAFDLHDLITEILIKQGFNLNFTYKQRDEFKQNEVFHATDGDKQTLICLDADIKDETIGQLKGNTTEKFICLERALDTTEKWNLNHALGERFKAI